MTEQEIKTKLIQLGFWGADEAGDPLTSEKDALVVKSRIEERLATPAHLASRGFVGGSQARHIDVIRGKSRYRIADGADYPEALCLTALALPEFLRKHPEFAAKD